MQEIFRLLIGVAVLAMGIPIGDFLKKLTLDEQKDGQKWFRLLISFSIAIGFYGLFTGNDWILFSFFFIAIVTSRSLIVRDKRIKKPRKLKK